MRWVVATVTALALAVLSLAIPAPHLSSQAFANRMNGKPTCGLMNCMQDRYHAAKRKEARRKNPRK